MNNLLKAILFILPLHLLFIKIKNFLFDSGIAKPTKVDATVLSIGNISLGGTGKTPFTISLSNFLSTKGFSVGIVTRGYGRKNPSSSFLYNGQPWEECGDEVVVLKNNLKSSIPIYISRNKAGGAKALSDLGCNIVILDDAFQHRKLIRDIDIVLVSPDELKIKNQYIFPCGLLREPFSSLRRADIIITTKINLYNNVDILKGSLPLKTKFQDNLIGSKNAPKININAFSKSKNIMSICAIGKPKSFERSLSSLNIKTKKSLCYPDHFKFDDRSIKNIVSEVKKNKISSIICTEKDFVKLVSFEKKIGVPIYAIVLDYSLDNEIEDAILCRL